VLELKQQEAKKDRRSRAIMMSVLGVVVVGLVGVVVFLFVQNARNNPNLNTQANLPLAEVVDAPTVAGGTGGIPIDVTGAASTATTPGAPVVEIYFDPICPFCGQFEEANGDAVNALVQEGAMNLVLHPVNFLDNSSQGTRYSTRAGAAIAYIAQNAPEYTLAFQQEIYVDQPAELSRGLSNPELGAKARAVGVPDAVADAISNGSSAVLYAQWVQSGSDSWLADPSTVDSDGQHGTPTIMIDGVRWTGNFSITGPFEQAVRAAAAG
jgi:protein-disulfide isomerase